MPTVDATEARSRLYKLLDEIAESHEPVLITGRRVNAVLISAYDWRSPSHPERFGGDFDSQRKLAARVSRGSARFSIDLRFAGALCRSRCPSVL